MLTTARPAPVNYLSARTADVNEIEMLDFLLANKALLPLRISSES
jgi:hypothetical protein